MESLALQETQYSGSAMSLSDRLQQQMTTIIRDDELHCRWLNTLSMLENVGACKISESERYFTVTESVLKHREGHSHGP